MSTNNHEKTFDPHPRQILPQLEISGMAEEFFRSKKIDGVGAGTIENYRRVLSNIISYCAEFNVTGIQQIDVPILRGFITRLDDQNHNAGGVHQYYRVLKTFLNWCKTEVDGIDSWKNPFSTKRLKAPKLEEKPLEPVPEEDVRKMIGSCDNSLKGLRNKALLMVILIPRGKGGKSRPVFFSRITKKVIAAYLRK